ncbi:class F sortase [Kribbella pratensis]|uniref:class F sortase n=1 Tax=Kribbella pratensis TaxID=2512112 RepID=UPI001EDE90EF|nr:class F sortase [Kribbella pratensis]
MSSARRRGRPAPLRWSGAVALVGVCALATGAYLQFGRGGDEHTGAPTVPTTGFASPTSPVPSSSPVAQSRRAVPESVPAVPSSSRTTARAGRPTGIHIAQLGVDAPVVAISAVHAALMPPSDPSKVGWWSGGAQPGGKTGSAVITGHTVHNGGGAFDNLGKLDPGSVVQVATVRGQLRYQVSTVTTYRKATLAKRAAQLFDQSVRGRLVLVTCEDWNGQVYLSNVVVIALPMA